jgi:integrase
MKLAKATVAKLRIPDGKGELIAFDEDLPGFGLRLRAGGSATWVAQYRVGPKQRRVTLGRLATLDPEQARKAARAVLAKADLGQDAQAERRERQAKAAVTFEAVAQLYLKHLAARRKPKTLAECRRHLLRDWKPFHGRPVDEVHRRDVAARLQAVADAYGPIASNRARATLSAFYAWAIGQGIAETNPVVGTVRVGVERDRERVLAAGELREIWPALGDGDHGRIVKLLLLTGQRRGEVAGIPVQGELDLDRALWSLPSGRTKNGLPHEVPLSRQAVALLRSIAPREGRALLFAEGQRPFSGWSKSKERLDGRVARRHAEKRLGRPLRPDEQPEPGDALAPWTLHDLRRTVVTGMNELGIAPHVVEAVVNHVSGRARAGVAGVYNRATYAVEKRAALQMWADHLDEVLGLGERKIVPLRA